MSVWKEVKYALNSSLGKKSFVPLDELIKGNRHIVTSGETLFKPTLNISSIIWKDFGKKINLFKTKFFINGQVLIEIFTHSEGGVFSHPTTLELKKNGEIIATKTIDSIGEISFATYLPVIDIDIGDEISVYATVNSDPSGGWSIYFDEARILGKITDIPIINV